MERVRRPVGRHAGLDHRPSGRPDDEACGLIEPITPEPGPGRSPPLVDLDEEPPF
jgi:hypothetical protein